MKKAKLDLDAISEILYSEDHASVRLPVCDHYAGKPKFLEKALNIRAEIGACFDITLDLEDGAEVGQERAFAQWAADSLRHFQGTYGTETRRPGVRLHPVRDRAFDMELPVLLNAQVPAPAYLTLPKPEHVRDVALAIEMIELECTRAGVQRPPVHVLIETHGALADVHAIAALPQIESLSFGIMDFISSHRSAIPKSALNSPGQFENPLVRRAKLEISAACHRYGKVPSHNVTRNIVQPEMAAEDAKRAKRDFGYTRMWSIHPAQIVHIVSAMLPTDSEVEEATLVLSEAEKANWGPIQIKGELHDRASYRYFFEVLKTKYGRG
ncbi:MAG TPA: aldolase/citrate lyase family protein [Limnobacter sp.]|nr:aldolase/citrate lyase family protein [Limnobacter sp.]